MHVDLTLNISFLLRSPGYGTVEKDPELRTAYCCLREPGFGSQHQLTTDYKYISKDPTPSSGLSGTRHVAHGHISR